MRSFAQAVGIAFALCIAAVFIVVVGFVVWVSVVGAMGGNPFQ